MSVSKIYKSLSSACCCLLGTTVNAESEPWLVDMGAMNYIEQDRNTGIGLLLNARRELDNNEAIVIQADFDVVTGATPNGASATNEVQSFTMASGVGSYSVSANELPVDDTHMDVRMALNLMYESEVNSVFRINYDSRISMEFDYLSLGGGVEFLYDINQHLTTLLSGVNIEYNRVHPVGGVPIAFSSMQAPASFQPKDVASISRRQSGVHIGINQILNKKSLLQLKYSFANATGYLTDPYKIVTVVDDQAINETGKSINYLYENRPDQRKIQNIYVAYKLNFDTDVIDLSYRYYWDEWDVKSSTLDMKYRYSFGDRKYIQPHLRIYGQSAAEFYRHSLNISEAIPEFASADFRLAEFNAYTVGFRYGKSYSEGREQSIGLEYYTQRGDSYPDSAVGLQAQQDLFPDLHVLVLSWNLSYQW